MALQLLKRNYVMNGVEHPKILKFPQGEMRWAPKRVPIDIGDVMMNIRMDDDKSRFINEHISKYAQGINPYGEFGYPYKVNKSFRPPIVDPSLYEPLSRMPVKFDAITAGPIIKMPGTHKMEIDRVLPKCVIEKVCPAGSTNPSYYSLENAQSRTKELESKLYTPVGTNKSASIQMLQENWQHNLMAKVSNSVEASKSLPINLPRQNPWMALEPKVQAAVSTNLTANFQYNHPNQEITLLPKLGVSVVAAKNDLNPYTMLPEDPYSKNIAEKIKAIGQTNPCSYTMDGELGNVVLKEKLTVDDPFDPKPGYSYIQPHSTYNRAPEVENLGFDSKQSANFTWVDAPRPEVKLPATSRSKFMGCSERFEPQVNPDGYSRINSARGNEQFVRTF